jgi:hypothetical protein
MAIGRSRDEPRSTEAVDIAEGALSEPHKSAERQSKLAQILAQLPEAMAAQAVAAGVLEAGATAPEPAGEQSMTVAYAPVAMVASPGRRRGSASSAAADGTPGPTHAGALTSANGPTLSGPLASRGGTPSAGGGAVASSGGTVGAALQRSMSNHGGGASNAGSLIQREPGEPGAASTVDVDALADEVFTRLRWRLSAERERMFG